MDTQRFTGSILFSDRVEEPIPGEIAVSTDEVRLVVGSETVGLWRRTAVVLEPGKDRARLSADGESVFFAALDEAGLNEAITRTAPERTLPGAQEPEPVATSMVPPTTRPTAPLPGAATAAKPWYRSVRFWLGVVAFATIIWAISQLPGLLFVDADTDSGAGPIVVVRVTLLLPSVAVMSDLGT